MWHPLLYRELVARSFGFGCHGRSPQCAQPKSGASESRRAAPPPIRNSVARTKPDDRRRDRRGQRQGLARTSARQPASDPANRRARLARDPSYDGRFYTGVHTTRISCRPVCPVRPARSANVSFFPSAAAAEAAGFRPCLRCRPETAPFCSAWIGSKATVERALRLIVEDGALDVKGATVERLAARLG